MKTCNKKLSLQGIFALPFFLRENAMEEYNEVCDVLGVTSGEGWMTMHYVNEEVYNRIDMENRTMIIENKDYIKRLRFDPRTSEPSFVVPGEFVY